MSHKMEKDEFLIAMLGAQMNRRQEQRAKDPEIMDQKHRQDLVKEAHDKEIIVRAFKIDQVNKSKKEAERKKHAIWRG